MILWYLSVVMKQVLCMEWLIELNMSPADTHVCNR